MGQYTENELNRLHKIELDILKEIIRVCDANELDYWVDWGTLLGAVRHNGFIPWDDDIDICMPRESYEKFLQVSRTQLNNDCVLQHYSVDKRTPAYCAKVRKNGTLFVEESVVDIPVHQGIFVDIYPIDSIPDDKSIREKYIKNATFWKQMYISKNIKKPSLPHSRVKKVMLTIVRRILNITLIPVSRDWLYKKLDDLLRQYNNSKCEMLSCIGTSRGEHYRKEIYPLKLIEFEGIQVKAPANIDAVLKKEYGNYMELPPVEKRVGHSPKYFSLDSSNVRDVK